MALLMTQSLPNIRPPKIPPFLHENVIVSLVNNYQRNGSRSKLYCVLEIVGQIPDKKAKYTVDNPTLASTVG